MDSHTCMVEVARFFMHFTQNESCGKCVPCREGTKRMLEILERIVAGNGQEEMVYKTPGGEVYHKSRDCTYLKLSVHMVSAAELPNCRNESGGKYGPCEYCVRKESPGRMVYIADYGISYHNSRNCQGLKRTVMAVPLSHTEGLRCCSRCGA